MRVMVYDNSSQTPRVELADSWQLGGWLYRRFGAIDASHGFDSWAKAIDWLKSFREVDEVQFWGHGSPGRLWINHRALHVPDLKGLVVRNLFWARTCSSFAGYPGQRLAWELANTLGCRVAGHTHKIGPFQSGLRTLYPAQIAPWSPWEGVIKGTTDAPQDTAWSRPWSPRTIHFLQSQIPVGW